MAEALLLVRHAMPNIVPNQPPRVWSLSTAGRLASAQLAHDLTHFAPDCVVASTEPKATETGAVIAAELDLPFTTHPGLHEHVRDHEPYESVDRFHDRMRGFFATPDAVVYGAESANAARERFESAIRDLQASHGRQTLVIVTHGTVMTLLVAAANGLDPFTFWQRLTLPALVVVGPRTFKLMDPVG